MTLEEAEELLGEQETVPEVAAPETVPEVAAASDTPEDTANEAAPPPYRWANANMPGRLHVEVP